MAGAGGTPAGLARHLHVTGSTWFARRNSLDSVPSVRQILDEHPKLEHPRLPILQWRSGANVAAFSGKAEAATPREEANQPSTAGFPILLDPKPL
jgi:hypothetical protein